MIGNERAGDSVRHNVRSLNEKSLVRRNELEGLRVGIVGFFSGPHIAASFARAGEKLRLIMTCFDVSNAKSRLSVINKITWKLADHRAPYMSRFGNDIFAACRYQDLDLLICTGTVPLDSASLIDIKSTSTRVVNYLTDDPWNRRTGTRWQLASMPVYDNIFSPRHANIADLLHLGCKDVQYLPFGFDEDLFPDIGPVRGDQSGPDVLFVGGADQDRISFMRDFLEAGGPRLALVGGAWGANDVPGSHVLGIQPPPIVRSLTRAAAVNLCLVRRANRDDHVMRSLEIAASGGCMIAEDTIGHRELFGPEGDAVLYFSSPAEASSKARILLGDVKRQHSLQKRLYMKIRAANNTYSDRLEYIINHALP